MKKWTQTPNGIESDSIEISYKSYQAFPIFITHNFGVICGDSGDSHSNVTGEDKKNIVTFKAWRLLRLHDESINGIDLSGCNSNMERANRVANAIIKDIYADGMCFDLSENYGQIVFTFWSTDVNMKDIINKVCEEKELNKDIACVAKPFYDDDALPTPDEIAYGGRRYSYISQFARPFTVFLNPKAKKLAVRVGEPGERHDEGLRKSICRDLSKIGFDETYYDKLLVVEGRFWRIPDDGTEIIIFSFWSQKKPVNEKRVMEYIAKQFGFDMDNVYYTNLDEIIKANTDEPIKVNDQELLDKLRAIHLMSQEEKREALSGFRDTRDTKWDNEHRREDGSVPTKAEYNASIPFRE